MTWLTRAAVEPAQRHHPACRGALHLRRHRLGQPEAGAPAGRLVPRRDRHRPVPGAPPPRTSPTRSSRRSSAPCTRSPGIDQVNSTSANSIGFITAQFEYGTDVDEATAAMEEAIASLTLPEGVDPTVSRPEHQCLAGRHRRDQLGDGHADRARADRGTRRDRARARGDLRRRRRRDHRRPRGRGHDHPGPGRARAERGRISSRSRPRWRPAASRSRPASCRRRTESIPVTVIGEIATTDELEAIVVGANPTASRRRP